MAPPLPQGRESQARAVPLGPTTVFLTEDIVFGSLLYKHQPPGCFATGPAQKLKGKIIFLPPCGSVWGRKRAAIPEGCQGRRAALGAWDTPGVSPLPQLGSPDRGRVGRRGPVLQRAQFCTDLLFGCFNKTHPERTEAFWRPFLWCPP